MVFSANVNTEYLQLGIIPVEYYQRRLYFDFISFIHSKLNKISILSTAAVQDMACAVFN